ncbi:MAG: HAMP domain-containing histidine kinase [Elusimicrobia bacterium]|nr:HAMP domain-containing histidine kinase [Candidatus Obscuribacterium magneticum]
MRVSVTDTGRGIPAEELPHVFDRFYQGEAGRRGKGTGIGLAIAKMWVDAHGGRIWAESAGPEQGSLFWFTLPCQASKGGS